MTGNWIINLTNGTSFSFQESYLDINSHGLLVVRQYSHTDPNRNMFGSPGWPPVAIFPPGSYTHILPQKTNIE